MIPLTTCPFGKNAEVARIVAADTMRRRLESIGVVKGATLEVFVETEGGLIVKLAGAKIGLNRELAARIFVNPLPAAAASSKTHSTCVAREIPSECRCCRE